MFHLFQLTIKQMKEIKDKRDKSETTSPGEGFSESEILKKNWIFCKAHGSLNRSANKRSLALAPVWREDVVLRPGITAVDQLEEQLQINLENMNLKRWMLQEHL